MDGNLEKGFCVKTLFGGTVKVEKFLGGGGQGQVYAADYNGQKKALKWYTKEALKENKNPAAFYDNIRQNIMRGTPGAEFLWPLDITEWADGTFGYIMDLKPEGYHEVTDFMLPRENGVRFESFRTAADAAMRIVSAFRILHNAGYSYQDLNDGNFFINPQNGKVLICDNDNVAPDGIETGIRGKLGYMAPEIVMRKGMPDSLSDRFSMSIILYILFSCNHPLEGKRYLAPAMTPSMMEKIYGSDPLFIMDPDDGSNGPDPEVHKNSIRTWSCLPDYMRKIFLDSFSKKALEKPSARPAELEWLNVLTRFRSEIVPCQCGNEVFTQQGEPRTCEACGRKVNIPFKLVLSSYSIPAVRDSRLYRCQLGVCDERVALAPIAQVVAKKESGALGIRNKSGERWDAVTTKGIARKVGVDEVIPMKDGITFTVSGETITIKANESKGE